MYPLTRPVYLSAHSLFLGLIRLCNKLKPVNHCLRELPPRQERCPVAYSYILQHRMHPRADSTLHPHGHYT